MNDLAAETNDSGDLFCEFPDGEFLARANIDGCRVVVMLEQEDYGVCEIIDEEKFPQGGPGPPQGDFASVTAHRFMEAAH
jgi:hypothetical protein